MELSLHQSAPRPGRSIDRRLVGRVRATRRYLVIAVSSGVAAAGLVVVQAVLLASVISAVVLRRVDAGEVAPQLIGLGAAFSARAVLAWGGEAAAQRTSAAITSELRRNLLHRAITLGPAWLASERTGELSVTATRGIRALNEYFGRYLPEVLLADTVPVVIFAWMAGADWPSLLILLGLLACIPWTMAYFGRQASRQTQRQWRRLSSLAARYLELIRGLPTLRAFGQASRGRREVVAATEGLRRSTISTLRVAFLSALVLDMLAGLGVGLVAMVLGLRLLSGALPLSTALAVLIVSPEVFLPLRRAAAGFHASAEGKAAATRILDVLDTPLAAPPAAPAPPHHATGGRGSPDLARANVRLDRVRVRYPGRLHPALDGFDLRIEPGEHVALEGPSGAGKSTVLAVLLRFMAWEAGTVSAGGLDLASVDVAAWRRLLSSVPQRPHLVRGTLGDNLRLGNRAASDRLLDQVIEQVGLSDLVRRLPARLDTPVGDGGLGLSAGERQRVALARAVLREAPLVLLDEPSSHLDPEDVGELGSALEPWLHDKTLVVAAHHHELVARIDRVVTLRQPATFPRERDGAPSTADPGAAAARSASTQGTGAALDSGLVQ